MTWLRLIFASSIGRKYIVAITGIAMVFFLVGHLAGNLLVFAGPEAYDAYAIGLHAYPALLWLARIGLIVMTGLHIYFSIKLNLENRRARPETYATRNYQKASLSSRHMVLTGSLVLAFIIYHLLHFTFRVTKPEVAALGKFQVYEMIVLGFSHPLTSIVYIVALVLTGFHLSHGVSSLTQTLGLNHPKYNPLLRWLGPVVGVGLAAGFISIPLAVLAGIVSL